MAYPRNITPCLAAVFAATVLAANPGSVTAEHFGPYLDPRADSARAIAAGARGTGKPERLVLRVDHTAQIPAGTSWKARYASARTADST
jgi:hypothetical protein